MKITKFEQSGFILETETGYKIAIDIGAYTSIEKLEGISVDLMLVSHLHGDHFSIEQIKKLSPKKLCLNEECLELLGDETLSAEISKVKVGDTIKIDGIKITFFDVDHGPNTKIKPKENLGFLIEVDNQKIYFAGDMFNESGMDVASLEVDYSLIPVGGFYTFGPQEAVDFVRKFKKIGKVIPMHYQKSPETKEEFLKILQNSKIM